MKEENESIKIRINEELEVAKRRLEAAKLLFEKFGLRIIKTNFLDKKFGQYLRRAYEMRESSDYEIGVVFSGDEVRTLIKNAEEFLKKAQEFVEKRL